MRSGLRSSGIGGARGVATVASAVTVVAVRAHLPRARGTGAAQGGLDALGMGGMSVTPTSTLIREICPAGQTSASALNPAIAVATVSTLTLGPVMTLQPRAAGG